MNTKYVKFNNNLINTLTKNYINNNLKLFGDLINLFIQNIYNILLYLRYKLC